MSATHSLSVDPDYEISEAVREQIKIREVTDKKNFTEKVRTVIKKEFQNELELRENQLDLVQQRLNKAAKTMHLLRYCLVASYYRRNEFNSNEEERSTDNQNRLHPAIKKLLGNNSTNMYSVGPRRNRTELKYFSIKTQKPLESDVIREPVKVESDRNSNGSTDTTANNSENEVDMVNCVRNRNLTKHHVVVGNISKWMPSESQEDCSTHKWMVYVRGPKESPDVGHIIQKAVFYLHPSYKPNDVVELSESPFHLSRRGWGEFPLRVQLFFHCKLNKPVDIIHNLKLDRTYSGRQTLGNETIVELSLYDNGAGSVCSSDIIKNEDTCEDAHSVCSDIKLEVPEFESREEMQQSVEHDYCFSNNNNDDEKDSTEGNEHGDQDVTVTVVNEDSSVLNSVTLDHSYCGTSSHTEIVRPGNPSKSSSASTSDELHFQRSVSRVSTFETVVTTDGKVFMMRKQKRPQQSLLKNSYCKRPKLNVEDGSTSVNCDKYKLDFPAQKFRTVSQALVFLLKRLPLVNSLAADVDFKRMYPYVAKSIEEFSSWNAGKRSAAEWSRARKVKSFLSTADSCGNKELPTKKILLYARAHGYTPLANYNIFNKERDLEFEESFSSYSPNTADTLPMSDPPINVVDFDSDNQETKQLKSVTMMDKDTRAESSFIKQAALDAGVILKPEELIPGVMFNCAERVMLEAAKCFVDKLVRSARSCLVRKGNFSESHSTVTPDDISEALNRRHEFRKILSFNKDMIKY